MVVILEPNCFKDFHVALVEASKEGAKSVKVFFDQESLQSSNQSIDLANEDPLNEDLEFVANKKDNVVLCVTVLYIISSTFLFKFQPISHCMICRGLLITPHF